MALIGDKEFFKGVEINYEGPDSDNLWHLNTIIQIKL